MSTTTESFSSAMNSSDASSATTSASGSYSYTSGSYSTIDPPSHLKINTAGQSTVSAMSDPSAATSPGSPSYSQTIMPVFSPVVEETTSALEEASEEPSSPVETISADGVNIEITRNQLPSSPSSPAFPLECDYDVNPTELYRTIESKKWESVDTLFEDDAAKAQMQAATWVTRKETNGKLRWRLLPIHAAVIFQSPVSVVEKLLHLCPEAARAKDDQGMLPLHLAFRTKHTCWETIEELITSNPQAIFVKDRKGRTPLECGLAASSAACLAEANKSAEQQQSIPTTSSLMGALSPRAPTAASQVASGPIITPTVQKSIFSVLELYTQVSVQDQLQTAMNNSRQALESRIGAVQDSHVATLTQLKKDWENQRVDLSRKIQGYRKEIQNLKSDFNIQQELLEEKVKTEMELVDKLQQVTTALESKTVLERQDEHVVVDGDMRHAPSSELYEAKKKAEVLKKTNKDLLLLLETLLDEQSALKSSLDKLSLDINTKSGEQTELLNKYFAVQQETVDISDSYTKEWKARLENTSSDVSSKLAQLLSQNQNANAGLVVAEEYDGEEKKEEKKDEQSGTEI